MYDQVEDDVLNAVVKTRANLMRQYKEGHAAEWEVDKWIAKNEELTRADDDEKDDEGRAKEESQFVEAKANEENRAESAPKAAAIIALPAQSSGGTPAAVDAEVDGEQEDVAP